MTTLASVGDIENGTGLSWDDWLEYFASVDGPNLTHKQLVFRAASHMPATVLDTRGWAESVSVAYARRLGKPIPGQRQEGTFEMTYATTVDGNMNVAFASWLEFIDDRDSFAGSSLRQEPTITDSATWRRWRVRLEDGSQITIDIGSSRGTSVLTVTHSQLRDQADVETHRAWWKNLLDTYS
jgi:hypothetical protein